ncbi:MAG TPA: serine hydrolase [Micromonosporaceae bacterium]|nr:serine hydrolase [Micromonosporaceae bacterium]
MLGAAPLAASAVLAGEVPAYAEANPPQFGRIPESLKPGGELDQFVAAQAAKDEFSGTVLLTYRGRPILSRSHGMANKQLSTPNGPGTIFALASVTKLFTAVAIAQLVQRRKVAYNGKLGAYLGGFPSEVADKVTIHHLLTHTSGLGDHHMTPGFWEKAATWTSADEVMEGINAIIRQSPLAFAPGAGSKYSNSGYHLLGAIVAQVSGQSYYDYVREHIFGPVGMSSTDFYTRPQWRDDQRIARPYNKLPSGERIDIYNRRLYIGTPAGDAFSTCADMDRFAHALLGEKLLTPAFTQLTLSGKLPMPPPMQGPPGAPSGTPPQTAFQCYGPIALMVNNQWTLGHGGGSPGVSTTIDMYPDNRWVVVILSNYDMGTVQPIAGLARRLITGTG